MNGKIFDFVSEKIRENKLSHAYLVETNDVDKSINNIIETCKMLECPKEYSSKCSDCNICNLINLYNCPNVIIISPDGQNIKKEQIIDLKNRFATKPVICKYNIYIIKNAEMLNEYSENALLKFLEEPEKDIIGFLVTSNSDKLLNTITSRCQIINESYENNILISDDIKKLATQYYGLLCHSPKKLLLANHETCLGFDEKSDCISFFKELMNLFLKDIESDFVIYNSIVQLIKKVIDKLQYNVNIELLLDEFVIEVSDLYE